MKPLFSCLIALILFAGCGGTEPFTEVTPTDLEAWEVFKGLPERNTGIIENNFEKGQPLLLCLTFVEKESQKKLAHQKVHFYHCDATGEYHLTDPNDENTAPISTVLYTDDKGRAYVVTTLPGDYGSGSNNRHVHTNVFGAKPEAYDIHFEQYTGGGMGRRFINGSDQHFLANLKTMNGDSLITFATIECKFQP